MKNTTILAIFLAVLFGFNDIEQPKETKTITLPPIQPTTLDQWIDTCASRYSIPSEVIRGIGWSESHLGTSPLALRSNNLFGIKCGDNWKGERCGAWRKYASRFESVEDFCKYINFYYPHLIGKPLGKWIIRGYKSKPYKF